MGLFSDLTFVAEAVATDVVKVKKVVDFLNTPSSTVGNMSAKEVVAKFHDALQKQPDSLTTGYFENLERVVAASEATIATCGDSPLQLTFGRYLYILAIKALLSAAESAHGGADDDAFELFNKSGLLLAKSFRFRLNVAKGNKANRGRLEAAKEFKCLDPQKWFVIHDGFLNVNEVVDAVWSLSLERGYGIRLSENDKRRISPTTSISGLLQLAFDRYAIHIPLSKKISNIDDLCTFISHETDCLYDASFFDDIMNTTSTKDIAVGSNFIAQPTFTNKSHSHAADYTIKKYNRSAMGMCQICGATTSTTAKFCSECGAPLKRKCSVCGTDLEPSMKFCPECGTKLANRIPAVLSECKNGDLPEEPESPMDSVVNDESIPVTHLQQQDENCCKTDDISEKDDAFPIVPQTGAATEEKTSVVRETEARGECETNKTVKVEENTASAPTQQKGILDIGEETGMDDPTVKKETNDSINDAADTANKTTDSNTSLGLTEILKIALVVIGMFLAFFLLNAIIMAQHQ